MVSGLLATESQDGIVSPTLPIALLEEMAMLFPVVLKLTLFPADIVTGPVSVLNEVTPPPVPLALIVIVFPLVLKVTFVPPAKVTPPDSPFNDATPAPLPPPQLLG